MENMIPALHHDVVLGGTVRDGRIREMYLIRGRREKSALLSDKRGDKERNQTEGPLERTQVGDPGGIMDGQGLGLESVWCNLLLPQALGKRRHTC